MGPAQQIEGSLLNHELIQASAYAAKSTVPAVDGHTLVKHLTLPILPYLCAAYRVHY